MGKAGATDGEVEAAARAVGMHEIILGLAAGYDTPVGERGASLSGGQRQRLAIARAIISDPAILLLDDAAAGLDSSTADAIDQALDRIGRGRTMIAVSHRLGSAPGMDAIFVFHKGRLSESGRHGDLLDRKGLYAGFWRKQGGS